MQIRVARFELCLSQCNLTFDMSGGWRQAKLAGSRPLDGGVRRRREARFPTTLQAPRDANKESASASHFAEIYCCSRIEGVRVTPTKSPSGPMKRVTVWPQGSFLLLTSIR